MLQRFFRSAFLPADLGLLSLTAAGLTARYVDPLQVWWLQILAECLPAFAACLLATTILLGVTGRYVLMSAQVATLLLIAVRFTAFHPFNADRVPGSDVLHVLTLNARAEFGGSPMALVNILEREHVHIAGIQESSLFYFEDPDVIGASRTMMMALGRYDAMRPAGEISDGVLRVTLPLLSRLPFKQQESLSIDTFSGSALEVSRAEFDWDGRTIAVYNVHLMSYDGLIPFIRGRPFPQNVDVSGIVRRLRNDVLARAAEARALRRRLDSELLPFVLVGDLNSTPNTWTFQYLSRGLIDAASGSNSFVGGTYPSRFPLFRIDHVIASRHWEVVSVETVSTGFSDHRGVLVGLRLRRDS